MVTKRKWIYIIFLCSLPCLVRSQTLDQTFQLAEQFQVSGNYKAAIETYLRILFFDEADQYSKKALLNTANLYFQTGDFKRAATYYQRSAIYYQADTAVWIFQQKVNALLAGQLYQEAKEELYYFEENSLSPDLLWNYHLQWATVHYGLKQYDQSLEFFKKLVPEGGEESQKLATLIRKVKKKEKKSEALAFYMSAVIPGTGQMYAKDYRNGLNSLLLSGGLIAAGIAVGINTGVVDAILIVAPWWIRYHLGGMYGADLSVRNFKIDQRHKIYLELLSEALSKKQG